MSILRIDNITKSFEQNGKKVLILKDLSFNLETGKTLALMGKSGSGKSTLLSLVLGLFKADSGSITFDNQNLFQQSEDALTQNRRTSMGMIFQSHQLVETLSAWENVWLNAILRNVPDPETVAQKMLEQVELGHRLHHLPSELSGGENQRVAIARALVGNPKLVLADEPNANLDSETGKTVMNLMFKLVRERKQTLLLVTHDLELAKECDAIYQLNA
jgi:putative ABC transport system ATP-binding protein